MRQIPDQLTLSIILGNPDEIISRFVKSVQEVHPSDWKIIQGRFCVNRAFSTAPPPGGAHKHRVVVLTNGCMAFFCANLADGWNSLAFRVSRQTNSQAFCFGLCSDTVPSPGRFVFAIRCGTVYRSVSVIREDKWVFFQEGAIMNGEDPEWYRKRQIRTRLTNDHILHIAEANGINLIRCITGDFAGVLLEER